LLLWPAAVIALLGLIEHWVRLRERMHDAALEQRERIMEVILLERIEKLGQMGDVVNVKPGYARNYLLPRKKALRASEASRAVFQEQRAQLEAENIEQRH
jgi:hypothetical protein